MDCNFNTTRQRFKSAAQAFVHLLYPPLCLHCQTALKQRVPLFCSACLEQLSLTETNERCRTCFAELHKGRCDRCIHRPVVIRRQLAACDAMGPAGTLLRTLCNGSKDCISAAASLMAYQWLEQKLLLPDFLIPLPTSFWNKQKAGFDPHLLLAIALGKIFSAPVLSVLQKKFDRFHFLTHGDFRHCVKAKVKDGGVLCDRRILLVAPEMDDAAFRSAGNELKAFFPSQIEALAFTANWES